MNSDLGKIIDELEHLRGEVLPAGSVVTASTTLAASPALADNIQRHATAMQAENERLRAQVDLLKRENDHLRLELLVEIATNAPESAWSDLDETHGEANDTPGSQPIPCDTKARKSITSAEGEDGADVRGSLVDVARAMASEPEAE